MSSTSLGNEPDKYGLSLVLGGGAVHLIDLARAYSVLSQDGVLREQAMVMEVRDKNGNVLEQYRNQEKQVVDANYANRGELLLEHQHSGMDLRADYARETLAAIVRCWKRPALVATKMDGKQVLLRYDGKEHSVSPYKP